MGEGDTQWWSSEEEYRFLESIVVVCMFAGALFFDQVMHFLRHWVMAADHHPRHDDIPYFYEALFNRASGACQPFRARARGGAAHPYAMWYVGSGELMVLGFLAFVVWSMSRWGAFEEIVAALPPDEGVSQGIFQREPFSLPSTGSDLLHLVEDAHMQIFAAMNVYFIILTFGIFYIKRMCERWQAWEEDYFELFVLGQRVPSTLAQPLKDLRHAAAAKEDLGQSAGPQPSACSRLVDAFTTYSKVTLSTKEEFYAVKRFYIDWAQSGALSWIEERRRKKLKRAGWTISMMAMRPKLPQQASATNVRQRKGTVKPGEHPPPKKSFSQALTYAKDLARSPVSAAPPAPAGHGAQRAVDDRRAALLGARFFSQRSGVDVLITEQFRFAEYLTFCFSEYLEELVEFKAPTWLFSMLLRVIEASSIYLGAAAGLLDIAFAIVTVVCVLAMWILSKSYSKDVLRSAAAGVPKGGDQSWFVRLERCLDIEMYFLRVLQALTWRNLFRVMEFALGPTLSSYVAYPTLASATAGVRRIVLVGCMSLVALMLPFIAFDWGLSMFLPPHIDERNVEVAELVRRTAVPEPRGAGGGMLMPARGLPLAPGLLAPSLRACQAEPARRTPGGGGRGAGKRRRRRGGAHGLTGHRHRPEPPGPTRALRMAAHGGMACPPTIPVASGSKPLGSVPSEER